MKVKDFGDHAIIIKNDSNILIVADNGSVEFNIDHVEEINNMLGLNNSEYIKDLEACIADFKCVVKSKNDEIAYLNNKLTDSDVRLSEATNDVIVANNTIQNLNDEIKRLKERIDNKDNPKVKPMKIFAKRYKSAIYDIDDEIICETGRIWRAAAVVDALKEGKVTIQQVKMLYPDRPSDDIIAALRKNDDAIIANSNVIEDDSNVKYIVDGSNIIKINCGIDNIGWTMLCYNNKQAKFYCNELNTGMKEEDAFKAINDSNPYDWK